MEEPTEETKMKLDWHTLTDDELPESFDFDGTIALTGPGPKYTPIEPTPGARETLKAVQASGRKIVVFTARHWQDQDNIRRWMEYHDIPVDEIICGKPLFHTHTDDRGIPFDTNNPAESWERARRIILKK